MQDEFIVLVIICLTTARLLTAEMCVLDGAGCKRYLFTAP